jgi:hypothetical protein
MVKGERRGENIQEDGTEAGSGLRPRLLRRPTAGRAVPLLILQRLLYRKCF